MNKLLSIRRTARYSLFILFFLASFYAFSGNTYTSTAAGGNWSLSTSWTGGLPGGVPVAGDDVIITNGATITITSNVFVSNITVQAGGAFLLSSNSLTITGNFVMNSGSPGGRFASTNSANVVNFSGAGVMNLTGNFTTNTIKGSFMVNSGTLVVTSGTTFSTNFIGNFNLNGGNLQNYGDITCGSTTSSIILGASSTWFQEPNSRLVVYSNIMGPGNMDASASGNNFGYFGRLGGIIFAPSTSYYNLYLGYGGTYTLAANTTVLGSFIITASPPTSYNGNGFTLHIGVSFRDNAVGNTLTNADFDFNGTSAMSLTTSGYKATESIKKLTISGSGTVTLGVNLIVSGDVNLNAGTLDVSASNYNLTIGGNYSNNGGFYNSLSNTTTFNNSSPNSISRSLAGIDRFNILNINSTSTTTLSENINVAYFVLSSGTFQCGSYTLNCHISWSNTGGTFVPGSGTVIFARPISTCTVSKTIGTETFNNVSIPNGVALTINCPISCSGNLSITKGSLDVGVGNNSISIGGNFVNNATFTPRSGTVTLNGSSPQTLNATKATNFYNLTQNGTGGSTFQTGTWTVTNCMTSASGTLAQSGAAAITLPSSAASTAYLGAGAGSYSGTFILQRYITGRTAHWQDFACPVTGTTLLDWDNEMYISGVGGPDGDACCPKFYSVNTWSEPTESIVNVSSEIALTPMVGYQLWTADNTTTWSAKAIDTRGTPVSGSQTSNLSYTAGADAGDNRIGNPYSSHIDWNLLTKTNVSATMYLLQNGSYVGYSGSVDIPPAQGFLAYATGAGASVTFTEASKVASTSSSWGRMAAPTFDLSFKLSSPALTDYYQENFIDFNDNASTGFDDAFDHRYIKSPEETAPSLCMVATDGKRLTRNAFSASSNESMAIPMRMTVGVDGKYTLETSGAGSLSAYSCALLEDLFTHQVIDLKEQAVYSFNAKTTDSPDRFILHLSRKNTTCEKILTAVKPADTFFTDNQVVIYSNHGQALVKFDLDQTSHATVSVYDLQGKNVMSELNIEAFRETLTLDLPGDANGLYLVHVNLGGNHIVTKKIFLSH